MQIHGIIFDVDGTLVDSIPLHFKSWKAILNKHQIQLSDKEIYAQFGRTPKEVGQAYVKTRPDLDVDKIIQEKTQFFLDHIDELIIFKGVPELLNKLAQKGIKYVLASNGARATIEKMVYSFDFLNKCKGIIAQEDVNNGKPHPEMIHKALEILALPPQHCLMVGDSKYDIQAAQAAHVHTIAKESEFESDPFQGLNPDYKIKEISELNSLLDEFI